MSATCIAINLLPGQIEDMFSELLNGESCIDKFPKNMLELALLASPENVTFSDICQKICDQIPERIEETFSDFYPCFFLSKNHSSLINTHVKISIPERTIFVYFKN